MIISCSRIRLALQMFSLSCLSLMTEIKRIKSMDYITVCDSVLKALTTFKSGPFVKAANNEIEIAKLNARHAKTLEETRHVLTHLESAASLVSASGFSIMFGTWDLYDRIKQYNELCYQIAYIHHSLGDSYSLVKHWADNVRTDQLFPDEFKSILLLEDYKKMESEYEGYKNDRPLSDFGFDPFSYS